MIILSSITKNTGRYAMIHTALFIFLYKITEIVRAIWLVKNLWFITPVNPWTKAATPRAIHKTGYWSVNNDFRKAQKLKNFTYPALVSVFYYWTSQFTTAVALKVTKCKAGKQITFHDDAKSKRKTCKNCVNFGCRKSLGKLNHVPTSNKTDSFSIPELFYVKIKFLNERNCS